MEIIKIKRIKIMNNQIENTYIYLRNSSDGKINKINGEELMTWFCFDGLRGKQFEIGGTSIHCSPGKSPKKRARVINRIVSDYLMKYLVSRYEDCVITDVKYKLKGKTNLISAKPGSVLLVPTSYIETILSAFHTEGKRRDPFIVRSINQHNSKTQNRK
jgi:hypothetical protein